MCFLIEFFLIFTINCVWCSVLRSFIIHRGISHHDQLLFCFYLLSHHQSPLLAIFLYLFLISLVLSIFLHLSFSCSPLTYPCLSAHLSCFKLGTITKPNSLFLFEISALNPCNCLIPSHSPNKNNNFYLIITASSIHSIYILCKTKKRPINLLKQRSLKRNIANLHKHLIKLSVLWIKKQ